MAVLSLYIVVVVISLLCSVLTVLSYNTIHSSVLTRTRGSNAAILLDRCRIRTALSCEADTVISPFDESQGKVVDVR